MALVAHLAELARAIVMPLAATAVGVVSPLMIKGKGSSGPWDNALCAW